MIDLIAKYDFQKRRLGAASWSWLQMGFVDMEHLTVTRTCGCCAKTVISAVLCTVSPATLGHFATSLVKLEWPQDLVMKRKLN